MAKPRMGETADEVWSAIKVAAGGVVAQECGSRIVYPTLRVVCGDDFRVDVAGKLSIVDKSLHGIGARDATPAEADEFHRDLNRDGVQVLLMSPPGFGSNYGPQRAVRELHSPSGNSFTRYAQ